MLFSILLTILNSTSMHQVREYTHFQLYIISLHRENFSSLHLRKKMSRFRRFDIVEHRPSYSLKETSIFTPPKTLSQDPHFPSFLIFEDELDHALGLVRFPHPKPTLFDDFDAFTDLIQIRKTSILTPTRLVGPGELYLQTLCDRVSDLELSFERLLREDKARKKRIGERKYTWTAEIERPEEEQKYKWTAAIKNGKGEKKKGLEKSYQWTAPIKGKGKGSKYLPIEQTYTVKVQSGDCSSESEDETDKKKEKSEKVKGKGKPPKSTARIGEIEEPSGNGGIVLRKVFAKRMEKKGKRIELSPQDAAALIQINFRAYLTRRSQALRALRELAIAKTMLKKIRALFNNFSYRRRLSIDAEERQKFSEKIIVLLVTVDAIEGSDLMVRAAKKVMVDELEGMLDVVDPQPAGRSMLMKRRTFDMPDGAIDKELAAGVAKVVQMLDDQEQIGSETFEACL